MNGYPTSILEVRGAGLFRCLGSWKPTNKMAVSRVAQQKNTTHAGQDVRSPSSCSVGLVIWLGVVSPDGGCSFNGRRGRPQKPQTRGPSRSLASSLSWSLELLWLTSSFHSREFRVGIHKSLHVKHDNKSSNNTPKHISIHIKDSRSVRLPA